MEQGLIFTEDKKDIEVFFLKPQQPKPLIDDSIDSANKDCYNDDLHLMNEQDVNENSAGGGAHEIKHHECFGDTHVSCCPVGHKGVQGTVGVMEDEADVFEAISECLEKFSVTDLNVNDSGSRDILSITITRKIKNLL